eukprot:GFUD01000133.1.p1 GENE.GFUD01000133.1~~GFUD01000133.1.p1  ORF type:complete len:563 (-),score=160.13 GFUD01000133.1:138-1826(-)
MSSSVVSSSLKSASLNIVTQVMFRLVTFSMNAFVLRHISRDVLGLVNVRLNLLDDTIMFLSKEGFRLACLGHKGKEGWPKVINLMWLTVPVSVFWSSIFYWVWTCLLPSPSSHLLEQYQQAVLIVALSGVGQMLAEPPWVAGQVLMFVRLRVVMDTVWVLTRVVVLCLAVTYTPDKVVLVWAWGHALAGLLYVLGYYLAFYFIIKVNKKHSDCNHFPFTSVVQLLPSWPSQFTVDSDQWTVATSFLGQGVMKQLLTEGERYVMTVFSLLTLSEQGIFDVVSNLGSLAARFIFRPVEESAYFFFSQLWERSVPVSQQDKENSAKVQLGLFRLLRLMLLLGLTVVLLGYSYSHLLLHLYGGLTLTDGVGPQLLRSQCLLILFLSVNGITECFARAAMSDGEINSYTRTMSVMSVVYLALAFVLTKLLGPVGFVLANCCNMVIRIGFSVKVIKSTFSSLASSPLSGLAPDNDILFLLLTGGVTCQLSEIYLYQWSVLAHLVIGVVVGVMVVVAVVVKEDFILAFIVEKFKAVMGYHSVGEDDNDEGKVFPENIAAEDNLEKKKAE